MLDLEKTKPWKLGLKVHDNFRAVLSFKNIIIIEKQEYNFRPGLPPSSFSVANAVLRWEFFQQRASKPTIQWSFEWNQALLNGTS